MISLRLFLLVLITLASRELGGNEPPVMLFSAGLAAVGVSLGFGLLFKFSALHVLSYHDQEIRTTCTFRFNRLRGRIESSWLLTLPAALLATGWGPWLNSLELHGLPQSIALLGWFFPSCFLLVLMEMTAAQFDELLHADECPHRASTWLANWRLRLRLGDMASLITCVAPVLLIALLTDVATWISRDELTSQMLIGTTLLAVCCIVLFFPIWLGGWMGVGPLPRGGLRDRIECMLRGLNIRGVRVMLLNSNQRWAGAAIVGWLPLFRRLWLGDRLIQQLTDRQLDMVIMHELAHVTRKHFLWRVLPVVWALGAVAVVWICWPVAEQQTTARDVAATVAASLVLLVGLGTMARACELDADRSACQLAVKACAWARNDPAEAGYELGNALTVLLQDAPSAAESTWLHPSLRDRLLNLHVDRR